VHNYSANIRNKWIEKSAEIDGSSHDENFSYQKFLDIHHAVASNGFNYSIDVSIDNLKTFRIQLKTDNKRNEI
jgi:hypothetical protein